MTHCLGPEVSTRLLRLGVLVTLLAGCREAATTTEQHTQELPFSGQQVTVIVPAESSLGPAWSAPLAEWGTQTGGSATLVEYPPDDATAAAKLARAAESPAIAVILYAHLGDAVAGQEFDPVPEPAWSLESGIGWQDLFPGVREGLASSRRRPMLLPLAAPALVLYYRVDLLQAKGLNPPQTWEEYGQLLDTLADWAPGLVAVEPWGDASRTTMFLSRAVSHARHPEHYSVFVDLDSGKPLIDNPAFLRTLEQSHAALAKMPADVWKLSPLDCRRMILDGRAALAVGYEPAGGQNRADTESWLATRADGIEVGVCRLPGVRETYNPTRAQWEQVGGKNAASAPVSRATLTAFEGYVACCFAKPGKPLSEARWNAFVSAAGPDLATGLPPGMAGLTRNSQLANPTLFTGPELSGFEAEAYLNTLAEALREPTLVHELPFPRRGEFRKALDKALVATLRQGADSQQSLQQVAVEWSGLIESIGLDAFRGAYRQLLGLGPRLK